jgi:hypothetical protein
MVHDGEMCQGVEERLISWDGCGVVVRELAVGYGNSLVIYVRFDDTDAARHGWQSFRMSLFFRHLRKVDHVLE